MLSELERISKGNIDLKTIDETVFENDGDDVTIHYEAKGKKYTSVHHDEYEDGTLMYRFVANDLLPNLKGTITNGHIAYWGDEYFTFVYSPDVTMIHRLQEIIGSEKGVGPTSTLA